MKKRPLTFFSKSPVARIAVVLSALIFLVQNVRAESPIDFSTSDNLKAVYDAGYRPWRDGMSSCNLDHKRITVILPGKAQFSLASEMAGFSVLAGDQISSADFIGEVTSTDEATAKTREICEALGISTAGLDHAVPNFADRFSKASRWGGKTKKGDVSVQVMLDLLFLIDHIEAKVYVSLNWNLNNESMKFLTSPMQPPAGYEHESMAPPPTPNNPNPHQPYHTPEEYRSMIKRMMTGSPTAALPVPSSPSSLSTRVQTPSETTIPFWLYGVSVLSILAIFGVAYYLSERGGKGP